MKTVLSAGSSVAATDSLVCLGAVNVQAVNVLYGQVLGPDAQLDMQVVGQVRSGRGLASLAAISDMLVRCLRLLLPMDAIVAVCILLPHTHACVPSAYFCRRIGSSHLMCSMHQQARLLVGPCSCSRLDRRWLRRKRLHRVQKAGALCWTKPGQLHWR